MELQDLNSFITTDFNIFNIVALQQFWRNGSRFSYQETPRPDHGLFLLNQDSAVYEIQGGGRLYAHRGDILFLPKGSRYAVTFSHRQDTSAPSLLLNFLLSDTQGNEPVFPARICRIRKDDSVCQSLFAAMAQLYKRGNTMQLKSKAYQLFGELFSADAPDECGIRYIASHLTDRLSISDLAKRCGMCETAFRKRFRQLTGCAPVQYVTALKIEKACQMLCSSQISTKDISEFLNFYSLPYFYKVFKDHTGMTPNQYRDIHGGHL